MDEMEMQGRRDRAQNAGAACRDQRDETAEREYREKVRAAAAEVMNDNREILNRLATK